MGSSPPSLRRELLASFAILFAVGILIAVVGVLFAYPSLQTPAQAITYLGALLVGDLLVLFFFGRVLLRRKLVEPVDRLVEDTGRIAGGDYRHRVRPAENQELSSLGRSVNEMADRLIRDQERLAANVESLERTNRELMEARNEVTRVARLASAGSLAAGIAHEVGNPLGAIMSYLDVAKRRARHGDVDPELLDSIRQEAVRIDRIVRGLLDYARPEEEEAEAGPARPREVVEQVLELLDRQGRLDGIEAQWESEDEVPPVHMGPHRLEHVLMNLLLNSLDELEQQENPRIRIRLQTEPGGASRLPIRREGDPPGVNYAHRRRMAADPEGRDPSPLWTAPRVVLVRVEDNGPGIPEEDLERVFDPFYTTKAPGKGTGLGLAICARLVEGMGGRIAAANREEGGAEFTVRLPGVGQGNGAPEGEGR